MVTHVCSGVSGEVDVALELLCELVSQKPTEMAQYAVFVKVGVTIAHTASLKVNGMCDSVVRQCLQLETFIIYCRVCYLFDWIR